MASLTRVHANRGGAVACAALAFVPAACELPDSPDPPVIEVAYLLDRVDGIAPPAPVCEAGSVDQLLRFESVALAEDGTYGRAQEIQIEDNPPFQQEERGDFIRTDSTILLLNEAADTVVLTLLDSVGEFVRRIHPCGDVLRYHSTDVIDE